MSDCAEIVSKLKILNKEAANFQEKIENLYEEAGCAKNEIYKAIEQKIENIKERLRHDKESLKTEITRKRDNHIKIHKENIRKAKQELEELGQSVSSEESNFQAKGTRKKRVKSSKKKQLKKIKKTR
jgi:uncharacterized coiled-coil DUF342 family protein